MVEHWTPEELAAYRRAIKRAPESRRRAEQKRKDRLERLFKKLHRDKGE